jgi:pimeloyl-ACP methyl ester carboxylesterase
MIRLMADFDPAPYWRANKAPTLALFGGKDLTVPAAANRSLLESMAPAGVDLKALTLPSANHLMFTAQTGVRSEYATLSRIDPGYFSAIASWLAECA